MSAIDTMQVKTRELRRTIINMIYQAGSGHAGGSLSAVEILTVLYNQVLSVRPHEPLWPDRDRFVLSKGHAAPALYAVLADRGFFSTSELATLRQIDSCLQGHPCMFKLPGIDMSTGSLGLGLSVGLGMALAAKKTGKLYQVYVLCGDGEMQEGQNWEALMSIAKWRPDNLVAIIDHNKVQLDGATDQVLPVGDLAAKLTAFSLHVLSCDGHNIDSLCHTFRQARLYPGPVAIIAETVKGKGVSYMEGQSAWHGKTIDPDDYAQAMAELSEVDR